MDGSGKLKNTFFLEMSRTIPECTGKCEEDIPELVQMEEGIIQFSNIANSILHIRKLQIHELRAISNCDSEINLFRQSHQIIVGCSTYFHLHSYWKGAKLE